MYSLHFVLDQILIASLSPAWVCFTGFKQINVDILEAKAVLVVRKFSFLQALENGAGDRKKSSDSSNKSVLDC